MMYARRKFNLNDPNMNGYGFGVFSAITPGLLGIKPAPATGLLTQPVATTTQPVATAATAPMTATPTATTSVNLAQAQATTPTAAQQYTAAQTPGAVATQAASMGPAALTSDQVTNVIDANSPLMQRAAAKANEAANARGLLNSSMAIGSAQGAVMDAAVPIANANASAINAAGQFNASNQQQANLSTADASNKVNFLNTEAQNQASTFNAQQQNAMNINAAQMQTDVSKLNAQQKNAITINQLDQANKIQLANIQATFSNQMQANQGSSTLFNTTMSAINNIQQSTTMDAATKLASTNQQVSLLKSGLTLQGAIANLNLAGVLNFSV